jgi:ABC-type Fe3+/spermidine/putrescine transport system ATPase subunit
MKIYKDTDMTLVQKLAIIHRAKEEDKECIMVTRDQNEYLEIRDKE